MRPAGYFLKRQKPPIHQIKTNVTLTGTLIDTTGERLAIFRFKSSGLQGVYNIGDEITNHFMLKSVSATQAILENSKTGDSISLSLQTNNRTANPYKLNPYLVRFNDAYTVSSVEEYPEMIEHRKSSQRPDNKVIYRKFNSKIEEYQEMIQRRKSQLRDDNNTVKHRHKNSDKQQRVP